MAYVQKQFDEFHGNIRLGHFDENDTLREKRDIIRTKLDARLPGIFEAEGEECPEYTYRNQGSYEMGTGVKPLQGDFDIDQGIYFQIGVDTYPDPVVLKRRVHQALDGHTDKVSIRRSCVTVFYHEEGESIYHVDIAVYSAGDFNVDGKAYIAKGKENSAEQYRIWEISNPQALIDVIESKFQGNNRSQFQRVVRYLKRWKDEKFPVDGNAAPIGIGLTAQAYHYLQNSYKDIVAGKPDDLTCIKNLVQSTLNQFGAEWDADEQAWARRLKVELPVEPWNDLFEKMTNKQMSDFEDKLKTLKGILETADQEVDPVVACEKLKDAFGDDFPVPPREETAKRHTPAIVSSSNSAKV